MKACERTSFSGYFSGLILSALCNAGDIPELASLKQELAEALRAQIHLQQGSINYLARSEINSSSPYPDDLDSSTCVWAALGTFDPLGVDGSLLAKLTLCLTLLEQQPGGPYRTWIVPPDGAAIWKDTDIAVNANVRHFLHVFEVQLQPLQEYLSEQILKGVYTSPYYPSPFQIWYFLSRSHQGSAEKLIQDILACRQEHGSWDTIPHTVLAVSALLRLGVSAEHLKDALQGIIEHIIQHQGVQASGFCLDAEVEGQSRFAGCEALEAALCLEALCLAEQGKAKDKPMDASEPFLLQIENHLEHRQEMLMPDIRLQFSALQRRVLAPGRGRSIPLLPMVFHQALQTQYQIASMDTLIALGLANTYGWMAYTAYDDLMDGDSDARFLPLANLCLREVTSIFEGVSQSSPELRTLFHRTMDAMEGINAWEFKSCRLQTLPGGFALPDPLPDFGELSALADRSFGHALGPCAILHLNGFDENSTEMVELKSFFRHYLIARQLDDDAHDWEQDLRRGHLNAVACRALKAWFEQTEKKTELLLSEMADLQLLFWQKILPESAEFILFHVQKAELALSQLSLFTDDSVLRALLDPMRASAQKALHEQSQTVQFLDTYLDQTPPPPLKPS